MIHKIVRFSKFKLHREKLDWKKSFKRNETFEELSIHRFIGFGREMFSAMWHWAAQDRFNQIIFLRVDVEKFSLGNIGLGDTTRRLTFERLRPAHPVPTVHIILVVKLDDSTASRG